MKPSSKNKNYECIGCIIGRVNRRFAPIHAQLATLVGI